MNFRLCRKSSKINAKDQHYCMCLPTCWKMLGLKKHVITENVVCFSQSMMTDFYHCCTNFLNSDQTCFKTCFLPVTECLKMLKIAFLSVIEKLAFCFFKISLNSLDSCFTKISNSPFLLPLRYDSFTGVPVCQQNLSLEKASVLFNMGALYSQIATRSDRQTIAGLEKAISSFQTAAGGVNYFNLNLNMSKQKHCCSSLNKASHYQHL